MQTTNNQNNINECNTLNLNINSLSNNLNNLKNFIKYLKDLITTNKEEYLPKLNNLTLILPIIIKELGIPFCDLIIKDKEITNYYINCFLNNKSCFIKSILITLIQTFNFKSISINPCESLMQTLQNYDIDIKYLAMNPRNNKNEI